MIPLVPHHRFARLAFVLLLSGILTASVHAQPANWTQPYHNDPYTVALWHFDETTGSTVEDASSSGYHGMATNTTIVTSLPGLGGARSFADSPVGFISFGSFQLPHFEGTFEAWIRPLPRPPTSCDHVHFFIKGHDGHSGSGFTFYVRIYNNGRIDAGTGSTGGGTFSQTPAGVISFDGSWQHFAFTWSPSETRFYKNGHTISVGGPMNIGQTNHEVALARWGTLLYPDCRYIGEIDEVRISSVARTYEPQQALPAAQFSVDYERKFPLEARTALEHALDIWGSFLSSEVPIRVKASWKKGRGYLGLGEPSTFVTDFPNVPIPRVAYPQALAEALSGTEMNGSNPDINITFIDQPEDGQWYYGLDGNSGNNMYDFVTVALHELGHGLGFFPTFRVRPGGLGTWGYPAPFPAAPATVYDYYIAADSGSYLVQQYPTISKTLGNVLNSHQLYFDGPYARLANGGQLVQIGNLIQPGDVSHLTRELMSPSIGKGEVHHEPGMLTLGVLKDLGWQIRNTGSVVLLSSNGPTSGTVDSQDSLFVKAHSFALPQNYPNPFNPNTTIRFTLSKKTLTTLAIFNALGQEIASLVNEHLAPGTYSTEWNAEGAPSGVYFYRLQAGDFVETKKLVLLR